MNPPPIRYPLPTLILLIACGLIVWKGESATRPLRKAIAGKMQSALSGPPVPASTAPQRLVGPVLRRVLLKTGDVQATEVPDGRASEKIRLKQFLNVYDVWPPEGKPTHFRVGNRLPIGWIKASDVLEWSTRLVVKSGDSISPVISWTPTSVEVAIWEDMAPWQDVSQLRTIPAAFEKTTWGAWLSRAELLELMGKVGRAENPAALEELRYRAIVGQIGSTTAWSDQERQQVRQWLPPQVVKRSALDGQSALQALARFNESWTDDALWSGVGYSFVPLDRLP